MFGTTKGFIKKVEERGYIPKKVLTLWSCFILKGMETMARRTSRVIEKTEAPALLSENEVKVLMYMKDQEQHCDAPEGMTFGQFSVVCEMLEERGYIKEAKKDDIILTLNEPTYYHIMPRGYEAIVRIEQERERLNAEETKRKGAIISVDELNSLFANVVKKHQYYSRRQWQPTFWDRAMEYLLRLFDSERPGMHIYSIANELSTLKTNSFAWSGFGEVFDGNRIAFQMYLVIYYKYRNHPVYMTMLKALLPVTGVLGHGNRVIELHNALDQAIKMRELIMADAQQEKTEGIDQLWQQLKERNEEIGRLKEENERLKRLEQKPEHQAAEMSEETEDQKENDEVLYNKVCYEFFLKLLEAAGLNISQANKTDIGRLWKMFTGKEGNEIRKFSSGRKYRNNHTVSDIKTLNDHLMKMGITGMKL